MVRHSNAYFALVVQIHCFARRNEPVPCVLLGIVVCPFTVTYFRGAF